MPNSVEIEKRVLENKSCESHFACNSSFKERMSVHGLKFDWNWSKGAEEVVNIWELER